jgi:DNA-binding GntR family transcriptional regulator
MTARASEEQGLVAYRHLKEAIVGGRLQPNERLVETELAHLLETGRSGVREALVRLEQEGLVVREPNRGARVRSISESEAIGLTEARGALEGLTARYAARNATPEDVRQLQQILSDMRERCEQQDLLAYSELNGRLHERLVAISRHQAAARLLSGLKSQTIRFQFRAILQPGRAQRSLAEHADIVEAVAAGDEAAAETAMRAHLHQVVEALRAAILRGGWG